MQRSIDKRRVIYTHQGRKKKLLLSYNTLVTKSKNVIGTALYTRQLGGRKPVTTLCRNIPVTKVSRNKPVSKLYHNIQLSVYELV